MSDKERIEDAWARFKEENFNESALVTIIVRQPGEHNKKNAMILSNDNLPDIGESIFEYIFGPKL